MIDLLGPFLRITPEFKGKWRLQKLWLESRKANDLRIGHLPSGARVYCDVSVPYEAMVWLEKEELSDLRRLTGLLKRGDFFVDCGANIGIWSLVAASIAQTQGGVYAFEPNPITYKKLIANIELNSMQGVILPTCSAVAEDSGFQNLLCERQHNLSRLVGTSVGAVQVSVVTLDHQLRDKSITGIKIDVEGSELNVLHGARDVLARCSPWVCIEFNTQIAGTNLLGEWSVHQFLSRIGYRATLMADPSSPLPKALPPDWKAQGYVNLLYTRR